MTITLRRELQQLHGKLKKIQTLTLGHAIGLHSVPPLSYQAIREQPRSQGLSSSLPWSGRKAPRKGRRETLGTRLRKQPLIFELVLPLPGAIWIVIYLTFHILSVLFTSLMDNSKTKPESATFRKSRSLSGRAEFSAIARFWVRVLFKNVSFSVFSAAALVVSLTAVIIRTSHCNLSLAVDEFSSIIITSCLC